VAGAAKPHRVYAKLPAALAHTQCRRGQASQGQSHGDFEKYVLHKPDTIFAVIRNSCSLVCPSPDMANPKCYPPPQDPPAPQTTLAPDSVNIAFLSLLVADARLHTGAIVMSVPGISK
jgi:hypothetical protein